MGKQLIVGLALGLTLLAAVGCGAGEPAEPPAAAMTPEQERGMREELPRPAEPALGNQR